MEGEKIDALLRRWFTISECVERLPERPRHALTLWLSGMHSADAAKALKVTKGMYLLWVERAKKDLSDMLYGEMD